MDDQITLASFDISETSGFLPETPPLTMLPAYFARWNEVFFQLSDLLREGRLRKVVDGLPSLEFSEESLKTIEEWRAALVILSALFQGYLWQDGEAGLPKTIPSILAVPFHVVSEKIGTPLVTTYASTVLYNWQIKDPKKPFLEASKPMEYIENVESIANHTGTKDESWFFMIHVVIEREARAAPKAILNGLAAVKDENNAALKDSLRVIWLALDEMEKDLGHMADSCSPKTFYVNIRPYVAGTKGLDAFPEGIIYEGVDTKPHQYRGASAAQSTPIKAIDSFLGVQHGEDNTKFLKEMLDYMPMNHRRFLEYLSKQPSVRDYIANSNDKDLVEKYNSTIDMLTAFRTKHIEIVTRFIVNQKEYTVNPSLEETGTAGTKFIEFLKALRDDTKRFMI